jgi:hypothetical protein
MVPKPESMIHVDLRIKADKGLIFSSFANTKIARNAKKVKLYI